jgi:hypothetical protein
MIFLFVIIWSFFWSLYDLSFGHYMIFLLVIIWSFFWSLYGHYMVFLLVIIWSFFWSLYGLSFGHYMIFLLVIIWSFFWSLYDLSFGHYMVFLLVIIWSFFLTIKTGNVTDRPRAGRPRKTTPREDWLISIWAQQRPFSTAGALHGNLAFGGHISTCTVIRRLHHQGMRAWRPIKRPQLTLHHRHARFDWSFGVDYSHMETGPLVWWKSFFVTPYRRSCKGLAPTKHFSGQPHFGHNCFWG